MAKRIKEKARHKDTPPHIVAQGLYDGEWGTNSRLPLRALIRPEIVPLKVNVLGVLFIHTFPFETELAVVMRKLKRFEVFEESPTLHRKYDKRAEEHGTPLVTEVMTSNSIAVKLFEYWMEDYADSAYQPSKQQLAEMKKARQQLRKVFETLEADGWIERARLECLPQNLLGLGYEKAVELKLLTPLHTLPAEERRKLGQTGRGIRVGIFLLARPKPAKTYRQRGAVADFDYRSDDKSNASNNAFTPDQLFLTWGNEFGVDPEIFRAHPKMQVQVRQLTRLDQVRQKDQQRQQKDQLAYERQILRARSMAELIAREAGSPTIAGIQGPLFSVTPQPVSASLNPPVEGLPSAPSAGRGAEYSHSANPADAGSELVSQPRKKETPMYGPEAYQLMDTLRGHVNADVEGCDMIIRRSRMGSPKATIAQIAAMAEAMVKEARKKGSPFAWLIKYLPKKFHDNPVERPTSANPTRMEVVDWEKGAPLIEPDSEEVRGVRELLRKVRDAIVCATKDLQDAGTSSIATTRAKAKLQRLREDEEHLLAQLEDLQNRKPVDSEEGQARAEAAHGD
jgi:hypothetical protein